MFEYYKNNSNLQIKNCNINQYWYYKSTLFVKYKEKVKSEKSAIFVPKSDTFHIENETRCYLPEGQALSKYNRSEITGWEGGALCGRVGVERIVRRAKLCNQGGNRHIHSSSSTSNIIEREDIGRNKNE